MLSATGVRLAVMMFLQFFIWGAWYVTAYDFLMKIGFAEGDTAWTYSVGPISAIISPLLVGMIADRYFASERVMGLLHLCGGAIMLGASALLQQENLDPTLANLAFFGHTLCYYPTLALSNSVALHSMTDSRKEFPIIRVFGTIGWIVAGLALSVFGWDADKGSIHMFHLAGGAAVLLGIYSFTLPHVPPPLKGQKASAGELLGLDALVLLKQPAFAIFMLASFLICIPLAFYYQFAKAFVSDAGIANPAFTMSFGQVSEIAFMIAMPFFFVRLGVKWMLAVGMGCWVLRYALFAGYMPGEDQTMWIILGILLHGICYDFFFVTGQIYTDDVAPKSIRSQAQGILVLFTQGVGMLVGAQLAGIIAGWSTESTINDAGETVARKDWSVLWPYPCAMAAVVLVFFVLFFREQPAGSVENVEEPAHVPEEGVGAIPPGMPAPDAPPA